MYFSVPSSLQVTSGLLGSSTMLSRAPGWEQSSASNWAWSSGVTHFRSLAFAGLLDEPVVAVPVGIAAPVVADPVGVPLALTKAPGRPDLALVVAVPVAVGALAPLVVAVPVGVPVVAVPLGVVVGAGWLVPAAAVSTGRKRICDDLRIASSVALSGVPGMLTTMLVPFWVVTSAPATPFAST